MCRTVLTQNRIRIGLYKGLLWALAYLCHTWRSLLELWPLLLILIELEIHFGHWSLNNQQPDSSKRIIIYFHFFLYRVVWIHCRCCLLWPCLLCDYLNLSFRIQFSNKMPKFRHCFSLCVGKCESELSKHYEIDHFISYRFFIRYRLLYLGTHNDAQQNKWNQPSNATRKWLKMHLSVLWQSIFV